jgi:hypothetical protein
MLISDTLLYARNCKGIAYRLQLATMTLVFFVSAGVASLSIARDMILVVAVEATVIEYSLLVGGPNFLKNYCLLSNFAYLLKYVLAA